MEYKTNLYSRLNNEVKLVKMHFIGCKGVSMSVLMTLMREQGIKVSGSDIVDGGHSSNNVIGADVVVYNAAIASDNVELVEAKKRRIPIIERAELLGQVSLGYDTIIAVAGSHGKTTTTAMIGAILSEYNPTIHIGGTATGAGGSRVGSKKYFVTEACEYKRSFLSLTPNIGVILNCDYDHTDYYKTENDYQKAFSEFSSKSSVVVVDEKCKFLVDNKKTVVTFGINGAYSINNVQCLMHSVQLPSNQNEPLIPQQSSATTQPITDSWQLTTSFDVIEHGNQLGTFTIHCVGEHNVQNALASITVARVLGHKVDEIQRGLSKFSGIQRRFETVTTGIYGNGKYGTIIDDYAHHPIEITTTLQTAKQIILNTKNTLRNSQEKIQKNNIPYNNQDTAKSTGIINTKDEIETNNNQPSNDGKVRVIFQPHTYTRTQSLAQEFADALSIADQVALVPIYPAREQPISGVTHHTIAQKISHCTTYDNLDDAIEFLKQGNKNDITFVMGAGDIDKIIRLPF